jgi:predicted nuclease with TOPRIM domain
VRELKLELSRVKVDNRDLSKALDDRNAAVLKLMDELKKLQNKAKEHENVLQTRQDRIDDLLKQVRELTLHVARLEAGGKGNAPRKQIEPNPPPVQVNGKITKVDGPLVAIDLGSDHGLKEHHTLEVYRLQPEPKYLGMIRIVDVMNTRSVARFVGKAPELKEGDQVSSKLK